MAGLIVLPFLGWTSGTLLGALSSKILPEMISANMGILLYGMFIAIVIPPAKKCKPIRFAALVAAGISILFHFALPFISTGFAIILSALFASVLSAFRYPIHKEETK